MNLKNYLLLIIVLAGLLIRLQNFNLEPIDAQTMRQTDTNSVAYNFAFTNSNILYPQNFLIRPSGNINSYFFLEFPLYGYIIGILYRLFGYHIELAHLFNLFLYLIATGSMYVFVKKFIDEKTALWAAFFYSFSPASIFFLGHAVHPDNFAVTLTLFALALYVLWKEKTNVWLYIISVLALAFSISTRPFNALIIPAFLFLAWIYKAAWWEYPLIASGGVGFYELWKSWQARFPEANSEWENWILEHKNLLLQKSYLIDRLILKNIVGEVVGKTISLFAVFGGITFFIKRNKIVVFLLLWMIGIPYYWYFAPDGNVYHQYYADVYLVPIIITAALGVAYFVGILNKKSPRFLTWGLIAGIIAVTIYNGYRTSQYYFAVSVPQNKLEIAKEIAKYTPTNAKIVYLATFDAAPLSLARRKGWILGAYPDVAQTTQAILALKQNGANYAVAGKDNTNLPDNELKLLREQTNLIYKSQWVEIYKFK